MPDREKSSAPSPPPPETERDRMLRHTWAWEFDDPEVPELLARLGDTILTYAREGHLWGCPGPRIVPGSLNAIADDLDSLAGCLRELTETPLETDVTKDELILCRHAEAWAGHLRAIVLEIRKGIGEEPGEAESDPVAKLAGAARQVLTEARERRKLLRGTSAAVDALEDALEAMPE